MHLADVVFLVALLGLGVGLARLTLLAVRGRWREVRRLARRLAAGTAAYLAVVVGVSIATPRRWVALGERQCFDDWCIAVLRVDRLDSRYRLAIRVSSRARGRPQRAADARVVLVAADGRRVEADPAPGERSLQSMLQPGESFETVRDYGARADAVIVGADVVHGAWPAWFIIGDRGSLFHRRPLVKLTRGLTLTL